MFLWQFVIPLVIFVVAYWKILAVIRRQAKIVAERQKNSDAPTEPVAGTSAGNCQTADAVPTGDSSRSAGDSQVGRQILSRTLSQAQINVVRTMVYITVCFTLCWMPVYLTVLFKRLTVIIHLPHGYVMSSKISFLESHII